jgi:hypothetical protein
MGADPLPKLLKTRGAVPQFAGREGGMPPPDVPETGG